MNVSKSKDRRTPIFGLFRVQNRGIFLDITIFFVNVVAVTAFAPYVAVLSRLAFDGESRAQNIVVVPLLAMFLLPVIASVLKRWRLHDRIHEVNDRFKGFDLATMGLVAIPYLIFQILILLAVHGILRSHLSAFGETAEIVTILILFFLPFGSGYLLYLYFKEPHSEPFEFLLDKRTELVADICIFVNMILYQLVWNHFILERIGRRLQSEELSFTLVITTTLMITVIAMAIYLPPRIFYLAEDARKGRVWFTIFLANAPIIVRMMADSGTSRGNW